MKKARRHDHLEQSYMNIWCCGVGGGRRREGILPRTDRQTIYFHHVGMWGLGILAILPATIAA